jgi:hypothetical protein
MSSEEKTAKRQRTTDSAKKTPVKAFNLAKFLSAKTSEGKFYEALYDDSKIDLKMARTIIVEQRKKITELKQNQKPKPPRATPKVPKAKAKGKAKKA